MVTSHRLAQARLHRRRARQAPQPLLHRPLRPLFFLRRGPEQAAGPARRAVPRRRAVPVCRRRGAGKEQKGARRRRGQRDAVGEHAHGHPRGRPRHRVRSFRVTMSLQGVTETDVHPPSAPRTPHPTSTHPPPRTRPTSTKLKNIEATELAKRQLHEQQAARRQAVCDRDDADDMAADRCAFPPPFFRECGTDSGGVDAQSIGIAARSSRTRTRSRARAPQLLWRRTRRMRIRTMSCASPEEAGGGGRRRRMRWRCSGSRRGSRGISSSPSVPFWLGSCNARRVREGGLWGTEGRGRCSSCERVEARACKPEQEPALLRRSDCSRKNSC